MSLYTIFKIANIKYFRIHHFQWGASDVDAELAPRAGYPGNTKGKGDHGDNLHTPQEGRWGSST
jgi:hypothetical protein